MGMSALALHLIAQFADNAHHRIRQGGQAVGEAVEGAGLENIEPVNRHLGSGTGADIVSVATGLLLVPGSELHLPTGLSVVQRRGAPDVGGAADEEKGFRRCPSDAQPYRQTRRNPAGRTDSPPLVAETGQSGITSLEGCRRLPCILG